MSTNLIRYHKNGQTGLPPNVNNVSPSDKTFTSLSTLEKRQWSDLMGLPCVQSRMQLSSLLIALLVFKTSDGLIYDGKMRWSRSWISVLAALLTFFTLYFLQELRQQCP